MSNDQGRKKWIYTFWKISDKFSNSLFTENGVFNWTRISPLLRYNDIDLTFVVKDHLNFTNHTDLQILYCGCEKESQCKYKDVVLTGGMFQNSKVTGSCCPPVSIVT